MLETVDKSTKDKLKTFLCFIGILILMILILIPFIFLAKNSWNEKLKNQVEIVLENSRNEEYSKSLSIGKPVKINSTIAVSSNMYKVISVNDSKQRYALITRVTTYYGPQAGVFYFDENKKVSFEGFACLNERVSKQIKNSDNDITIKYWENQASKIFNQVLLENSGDLDE